MVSTPLKNISQLGLLFRIYGKNVPNHQPDNDSNIVILLLDHNSDIANNSSVVNNSDIESKTSDIIMIVIIYI